MEWQKRQIWSSLTPEDKFQRMIELSTLLPGGFQFVRMETFERFGQSMETGLFTYQDAQFLFVPGDDVMLGWDGPVSASAKGISASQSPDGSVLLERVREQFGVSDEEALEMVARQMSPVRQASVGAMLVERTFSSAGWFDYAISELDPEEDEELLEEIERFRSMSEQSLEMYQYARMERQNGEIHLQLFDGSETFEEWKDELIGSGFDLPTEEEWEYFYGAGARTLFPWGEEIEPSFQLKYFAGKMSASWSETDFPGYDLEQPNAFGLCFPGDPYLKEMVLTPDGIRGKGGDGGTYLHGGLGRELGYLPVATAFRDPHEHELDWPELLDCLVYRRIVRLSHDSNDIKSS
ncbi:hypothetical protein B9G55_22210 [Saccharibacillus sp. O16]|nr:hypothetical protein B9G55_22210 [Saccharibacillus sp. O16]